MDAVTATLLAATVAASLAVAVAAARRPVLWRMAVRNAWRRPRQTATVVAGLMVGAAIVSSALVASDSARGAIRGYVYQSLGAVDESVAIQGYPFFAEEVYEALRSDRQLAVATDGIAAHAIWQGAAEAPRSGLFEPQAALVGYDPEADWRFGSFELEGGGEHDGRGLEAGHAIVTKRLADALGVGVGDRVRLAYVLPIDPILPDVTAGNGSAVALPTSVLPKGEAARHVVPVAQGSTLVAAAVVPFPLDVRLDVSLVSPRGARHEAMPAPTADGTRAWVVAVSSPSNATLDPGDWSLQVSPAEGRVDYRHVTVVGYPVYDAALLQERAAALRERAEELQAWFPAISSFGARRTAEFTVEAVATGGRSDLFDLRNALFIRLDEAQRLLGREGQVNLVKVSNPGDEVEGEAATPASVEVLSAALERVKASHPGVPSVHALEVKTLKSEFLAQADAKGQTLVGLLVFAASLSILTGLLLILNLFTMLAEERRSELGMARAVGLTRGDLVRLFLFEGSLYAVAAAALGAALGLGLAYAMVTVMNTIVARLSKDLSFPPITYEPSLEAFAVALSVGVLLALATILWASRRQSRLNVVRAIRRIEEPERTGSRLQAYAVGLPMFAAATVVSVMAWLPAVSSLLGEHRFTAQVLAPAAAILGLGILLRPVTRRHRLVPALAALLAVYEAATFFLVTEFDNRAVANVVGPLRGVLLTLCVVVVVVHVEAPLRALARVLGRTRSLRSLALPAMSYPLHRKFRTGMTVAMFSIVLLSIGFFSIFGALFQTDPERQTGGFEVEARSTLVVEDLDEHAAGPPEPAILARHDLVEYRSEDRAFLTVENATTGTFRDYRHAVYGYDEAFAAAQRFRLIERLPGYGTDLEAYRGVLARNDQVIVAYIYSTSAEGQAFEHHVGDRLDMRLGNRTRSFTIAGIQEQYHFPGIFLPKPTVDALFPSTPRLHLFDLAPGADAQAVARELERTYRSVGLDARSTVDEVLEEQASFRQLLGAMKLFLGLGLVVGVLSLGIVTSRSVLERRQEIGMMRALGYTGPQVRRVFFLEVTTTILLGALVGIACALVVTYGLWFAVVRPLNYPYVVPWGEIALLVAASYAVALAATWAPIGRTAKVPPAEALRYVE